MFLLRMYENNMGIPSIIKSPLKHVSPPQVHRCSHIIPISSEQRTPFNLSLLHYMTSYNCHNSPSQCQHKQRSNLMIGNIPLNVKCFIISENANKVCFCNTKSFTVASTGNVLPSKNDLRLCFCCI